jgi:hypothetical protein
LLLLRLLLLLGIRQYLLDAKLLLLFKDDLPIIIYRAYIDQSVLLSHSSYLNTHPLQTILSSCPNLVKCL